MPVSKSNPKAREEKRVRAQRTQKVGAPRKAQPFLPNVSGKRYVRDESKGGIVPKMIDR